ncbi:MAG: hypothetical protein FWD61_12050 [Phycisphaerales bacterium]|nr:hypothetical protein [Phycisphaerales bacterium]
MKNYTNHRKAIEDRLAEMGKTKYWLAKKLEGKMGAMMLYAYMRGRPTTTQKLEAIFKVLGLKVTWEDGKPFDPTPPDTIAGDLAHPDHEDDTKVVEEPTRNVAQPPANPPEDERHFVLGPRHRHALPPETPVNPEFAAKQAAFKNQLDQLEELSKKDSETQT